MSSPGVMVSLSLFMAAMLLASLGGFGAGSILAALLAGGGAAVAGYGIWQGMRQETQAGTALSILLLLANLLLAGLMLLLRLIRVF